MRGWGAAAAALSAVVASSAGVAGAAEPTFVNGLAQNVFSTNTADWIRGEGWVQSTYDSDHDGKLDRIHFDITRPKETATGLKVPVILEASPYYANLGPNSNWSVDLEIGATPPTRPFQPNFATKNTSPKIATTFESAWLPRGFAVMHAENPGTGHSDGLPDRRRAERERRDEGRRRLDQRPRARVHHPHGNTPIVADWATGKVGMMGTSYNGSLPIAAAATGVAGPGGDRPDLPGQRLLRVLPRQRHDPRPGRLAGRGRRRARRRRLHAPGRDLPAHDLPAADRADRPRRGPRQRQPQRLLGRSAT